MGKTIILNKQHDKLIMSVNLNNLDYDFEDKEFILNKNLDLIGNVVQILNSDNLSNDEKKFLSLENSNIFVIDDSTISLKYRKDMADVMFKLLNISAFYIASQSLLSLYDNDITSGIIIDSFNDTLYAVPIFNENLIKNAITEIKIDNNEDLNTIIKKKIKSVNKKCKIYQQNFIKNDIIYSTNLPYTVIEEIDDFTGNIILGDPINGAKKIIPILDLHDYWITRDKYNETGSYIIEKKCFN